MYEWCLNPIAVYEWCLNPIAVYEWCFYFRPLHWNHDVSMDQEINLLKAAPATTPDNYVNGLSQNYNRIRRNFCSEKEAQGMFESGVFTKCDTFSTEFCDAGFFVKGQSKNKNKDNVQPHYSKSK